MNVQIMHETYSAKMFKSALYFNLQSFEFRFLTGYASDATRCEIQKSSIKKEEMKAPF